MNAAVPEGLALRLRGVALALDGRHLFRDLDLDLEPGRWTCLLGASGVGKTSLLRLIAGLLPAVAGRIEAADGRPLAGRAAYMAQQDLLLPWLPALTNVTLGQRLRGERQDRDRARELLAAVGLNGLERRLPHTLSGGQRQRVALARTLMEDRPLALLDEPFAALDAITRYRLQDLAARLLLGRTVLLVTHDPREALRLGHELHVLSDSPARLGPALRPPGPPPRAPDDLRLGALHGELLHRLAGEPGR
ncbi:MAG: ABC transporter ATP-binding protein [Candidatus Competibacterales bacterium]|nr:ABC transporter ATP-binding protein [Candidatus Competibacterales bacterium]